MDKTGKLLVLGYNACW